MESKQVREICPFTAVDIEIEDLFKLNYDHWRTGYDNNNPEVNRPEYYIYSILGGIVFLRFNEENQTKLYDFVCKSGRSTHNDGYKAWYELRHGKTHSKFNKTDPLIIPYFTLNERRVYKTIETVLKTNSKYEYTSFGVIKREFVRQALETLADPSDAKMDELRRAHNLFTGYLLDYIISDKYVGIDDDIKPFVFKCRTVNGRGKQAGKIEKECDEIHVVVKKLPTPGKKERVVKLMPIIPLVAGGGRDASPWSICNILKSGVIVGLEHDRLEKE